MKEGKVLFQMKKTSNLIKGSIANKIRYQIYKSSLFPIIILFVCILLSLLISLCEPKRGDFHSMHKQIGTVKIK